MTPSALALTLLLRAVPSTPSQPAVASAPARNVAPALFFPEAGLDDTAAYQGYKTRLYRDSKNNTVQIYLGPHDGRVVLLWADALDESAGLTVQDARGRAANLDWDGDTAVVSDSGSARTITYRLRAASPKIVLGGFLLGSMRVERDYQYSRAHLRQLSAPPFVVPSETMLVANVARFSGAEQRRQLALLGASSVAELRSRFVPTIASHRSSAAWTVRIAHTALDGKSHISIELLGDPREAVASVAGRTVSVTARNGKPVRLIVRVTTDGTALTPIARDEIFNRGFFDFLARARAVGDTSTRYRRLDREVRSVELLSSNEKLMAGLPNYATYFGRDGMMTALMMRTIWTPGMLERVIASVLGKLGPNGDVSHEEALGEQAIRERAEDYNASMAEYFRGVRQGDRVRADSALASAVDVLRQLRRVRENYRMIDDEFQLPVLEGWYLADSTVPPKRKRAFLSEKASGGETHLALMLREMALVANETSPFARNPVATNLVSFEKHDSMHWRSASWRDSDVGYANGRFAMDINAIWAPHALQAIASSLASLRALDVTRAMLDSIAPEIWSSPIREWLADSTSLIRSIDTWRGARKLFTVSLGPQETSKRLGAWLAALPAAERAYWGKSVRQIGERGDSVTFLALSLDAHGTPIAVASTDPATDLFLSAFAPRATGDTLASERALDGVRPLVVEYPEGLLVNGLGPVVSNDAFATPDVWKVFRKEEYHSPRVVWGREVNLYLLGMAGQISAAKATSDVHALRAALARVDSAVTASHLQHNELWSYRISNGKLLPTRYGTGSDVQLWSTTDLAVQFALSRLPRE